MKSLWGDALAVPSSAEVVKKVAQKVKNPKKAVVSAEKALKSTKVALEDKLAIIKSEVMRILGTYSSTTLVIRNIAQLSEYIDKAISEGIIAIDTETDNSLDPLTCKLMGACIYTPGMPNAYIPVSHLNITSNVLLADQLTTEDIRKQFERLTANNVKVITHNGSFDYQVLKCTTGYQMRIYWDTYIGGMMLDENERSHGLKQQYIQKIDPSIEKYSIEHLFGGIEYALVDPELFALYAATDAYMTYKLYEYQKKAFEVPEYAKMLQLFLTVEMPIVEVSAEMELAGVSIDTEYAQRLSVKYNNILKDIDASILQELDSFKDKIRKWRTTPEANIKPKKKFKSKRVQITDMLLESKESTNGDIHWINVDTGVALSDEEADAYGLDITPEDAKSKNEQLQDPINIGSPVQLAILLYDVLKTPVVDKKTPRGTGEDILKQIDLPICKLILKRRGLAKLISTYIDKLPQCISTVDGRVHAHFKQYGAATGRFSSSDPNLQNIPAHNKEIRMMFVAAKGKKLVGCDFSQQEPRLCAAYAEDESMLDAYISGKDLYATVAARVYNNNYEDNLEFFPDGSKNDPGAARRQSCKSIVIGLLYGRGPDSIAEQIGSTVDEARDLMDKFFSGFPKVHKWMESTQADCKRRGFVEDMWGRRRRLPDIQLPKYTIKLKDEEKQQIKGAINFNPLFGCAGKVVKQESPLIIKYRDKVSKMRGRKEYSELKAQAAKEGVILIDNGSFISQAERQSVNARIQGGAATISKKAMIKVYNDERLREMDFKLLIAVHDELIGEVAEEYAEEAAQRLSELMVESAKPECVTPMKCDASIIDRWYEEEYSAKLLKDYHALCDTLKDELLAYNKLRDEHIELTDTEFKNIISNAA